MVVLVKLGGLGARVAVFEVPEEKTAEDAKEGDDISPGKAPK